MKFNTRPALLGVVFMISSARSEEWIVVGPRAVGMGGAGVAVTRGPLATYWNPANLAISWSSASSDETLLMLDVAASASYGAQGDVIRNVDIIYEEIEDIDWKDLEDSVLNGPDSFNDPGRAADLQTLLRVVTERIPALNKRGEGVAVNADAEVGAQLGRFALALRGMGWGAVNPSVDLASLNLAFGQDMNDVVGAGQDRSGSLSPEGQALADNLAGSFPGVTQNQAEEFVYQAEQGGVNTGTTAGQDLLTRIVEGTTAGGTTVDNFISTNQSGFRTRGLGIAEAGITYAHPFLDGRVAIGGTLKAMYGVTYSKLYGLQDLVEGSEVFTEVWDREHREESVQVGVDAGVTALPIDLVAVGIVGRNLNQPTFDARGKDYELDPQVRAGVAVFPLDWVTLAADMDVLKNDSEALAGYESQTVSGGAEVALFDILMLRAGLSKNVLTSEGLTYHFGLGLHTGPLHVEIAGAASADTTPVENLSDDVEIPDRAHAAAMVEVTIEL